MPAKKRPEKLPYQRLSKAGRRRTIGLLQKLKRLVPRSFCRELIIAQEKKIHGAIKGGWNKLLPNLDEDGEYIEEQTAEVVNLLFSCWINILWLALDKEGETQRLDLDEYLLPVKPVESFFQKGGSVSSWYDLFVPPLAKHIDPERVPELVKAFTASLAREADERGYLEVYQDRGGTVSIYPGEGKRGYFLA